MTAAMRFGPKQQDVAARARAFVESARQHIVSSGSMGPAVLMTLRALAAEQGLLAVDAPVEVGGAGLGLLEALAVAEVMGEGLPRPVTAALFDGVPARVLGVREAMRPLLHDCVKGTATAALLDVGAMPVRMERRPGGSNRLVGDIPPLVAPPEPRTLLFVFEERPDWHVVAIVSPNHAALRSDPLQRLPLSLVRGVLDVEVREDDLIADAGMELLRALAAEELVRAARAVGEASVVRGRRASDGADRLMLARTALYAATERLIDGGPHTLLGEEPRLSTAGAALEARALAHQALYDAARIVYNAHGEPSDGWPGWDWTGQVLASELDCAQTSPADVSRSVWFKLGEARPGAIFGTRTRSSSSSSRSSIPEAAGDDRKRTASMRAVSSEHGPMPFVPEEARRIQQEARQLIGELLEGLSSTIEKDGELAAGGLEAVRTRGWLCATTVVEASGPPVRASGLLALLEELGRAHQAFSALVAPGGVAGLLLARIDDGALAGGLRAGELRAAIAGEPIGNENGLLRGETIVAGGAGANLFVLPVDDGRVVMVKAGTEGVRGEVFSGEGNSDAAVRQRVHLEGLALDGGTVIEGAAAALRDLERLASCARVVGMTTHALEIWRSSLSLRPDASRLTHAQRLGQWWTRLAQVRAMLWSTALAVEAGERAGDAGPAVLRSALDLCQRALENAVVGVGVEGLAPGARLREHLRQARILRARL